MQPFLGVFILDEDGRLRSAEMARKRVRRRLDSVTRRLGPGFDQKMSVDDSLLTSLNDFVRKVETADLGDLYDCDQWPCESEAENARQTALKQLKLLRRKWKASMGSEPTPGASPLSKMDIQALIN